MASKEEVVTIYTDDGPVEWTYAPTTVLDTTKWFTEEEEPPSKKRGRPKGSTNKPKTSSVTIPLRDMKDGQVGFWNGHIVMACADDKMISLTNPEYSMTRKSLCVGDVELYPPGTVLRVEILK